jgi:hypothetical protein
MTTSKRSVEMVADSEFAGYVPEGADPVVEPFDVVGVHGVVLWSVADPFLPGMYRGVSDGPG